MCHVSISIVGYVTNYYYVLNNNRYKFIVM